MKLVAVRLAMVTVMTRTVLMVLLIMIRLIRLTRGKHDKCVTMELMPKNPGFERTLNP